PLGTDWSGFAPALEAAVQRLRDFEPDAVVVSMGFDTHKDDPISKFHLETEDFVRIGEMLDGIRRPTLTVLEGGYAIEALPRNVLSYIRGFMGG
ncbi:MAG: histone deacetylase family protein, partial [Planctomycetota bacterium]